MRGSLRNFVERNRFRWVMNFLKGKLRILNENFEFSNKFIGIKLISVALVILMLTYARIRTDSEVESNWNLLITNLTFLLLVGDRGS